MWITFDEALEKTGLGAALLRKVLRQGDILEQDQNGDISAISLLNVMPQSESVSAHPAVASLFSGCGGLDLGFRMAGFGISYANDNALDAAATYCRNIGPIDPRPIQEVDPEALRDFDVLVGGFPCQPFSNAGSRKGTSDPRGTLFWDALRFVKSKKPSVVVFENVRGILSIRNPGGGLLIDDIESELQALGYITNHALLNAADFGVPQNRLRVFIVGSRKDVSSSPFDFASMTRKEPARISEALAGVENCSLNNHHWELSPQAARMAALIPEGGSWKSVDYDDLPDRLKRIRDDMNRYHSPNFYRRFRRDEVMGTITAAGTPENSGILHPTENRRYTIREIARFQTFPDDFEFLGKSLSSQYRQIGNAVPPLLGRALAVAVRQTYFEGQSAAARSEKQRP